MKLCKLFIISAFLCWGSLLQAATFTVTNTTDASGNCLRWAITAAISTPGPDLVDFNIPGAGPHTIFLLTALPPLLDYSGGTTIDGLSQPGASAGSNPPSTATLMIVLDGSAIIPAFPPNYRHGIWVVSPNNVVQGLVVQNMPHDGICIETTFPGSDNNLVYCNFTGTDYTGTMVQPNGWHQMSGLWAGIHIICPSGGGGVANHNIIDRNLSSGNWAEGIAIQNNPPYPNDVAFNQVLNNYCGVDITGTMPLMGNIHCGIYLGEGTHDNLVDGNISSANGYDGISVCGYAEMGWYTNTNTLSNNLVGVDVNLQPLGNINHGVNIGAYGQQAYEGFAQYNRVVTNTIAHNLHNGVMVWENIPFGTMNTDWNTITQNSIYLNGYIDPGYLGIDLGEDGLTLNDVGDPDQGPNEYVNFPVITSVINNTTSVTIYGVLDLDTPENLATVEVFQAIPDATGLNHGQGAVYLGSATPNASGAWQIIVLGIYGQDWVTSTATDWVGNTSEFSANYQVPGEPADWDFGDADDPTFPTLMVNNGARHLCGSAQFLGTAPDAEPDGQPSPMCDGDDMNGLDEDGVMYTHMFISGQQTSVTVFASTNGLLDMWIDFGADGSWMQPGDQVCNAYPLTAGANVINFTVPAGSAGFIDTSSRYRFSTWGGLATTGSCNHGEVEDWTLFLEEDYEIDYGDAPDPTYPTLFASNGASHVITSGLFLGSSVDGEFDGQPDASATGDDLANIDDEDGITFMTPIFPGQPFTIQAVSSGLGILNAWLDFNGNGSWADASDYIIQNQLIVTGTNSYTIMAPASALTGTTYARFRLNFQGGISYTGQHWCGEVEDYEIDIEEEEINLDFGDAPDPTYPTLLANNGARHQLGSGLFMGATVDGEPDGQPDPTAIGDDLANIDDEDGVTFMTPIIIGQSFTIQVVASMPGILDAWLDFDINGTWADPPDWMLMGYPLNPGPNMITIPTPATAIPGWTFARFRISGGGVPWYDGFHPEGEVEDYHVEIEQEEADLDFGDAPDPTYPTLLANNGARHQLGSGLFMGATVDGEFNGQPDPTATGDDLANIDDEDGVTFMTPIIIGQSFTIQVVASTVPAVLDAWIDFDINGSWADPPDWILMAYPLVPGPNMIMMPTPATAIPGWTFARFRISGGGVPWYDGFHPDGEVEDYQVEIEEQVIDLDFGDAPDPTYPTLLANNGARHRVDATIVLGALIDPEADGQPNATATGDDLANLADEDGVVLSKLVPGRVATATVTASANGLLSAWIDFNIDGDWADAGEQIFTDATLAVGVNTLTFAVPAGATLGYTFNRWRYDTGGGLNYYGVSPDGTVPYGEVEDYQVEIECGVICPTGSIPEGEPCGLTLNQGCNIPANPQFTAVACLDTMCALTWADTSHRDTDWYELQIPTPMRVRMTLASDISLYYGLVEPLHPGQVDCDSLTGFVNPYNSVSACGNSSLEIDMTAAGSYWLWVGPQVYTGFPCIDGPHVYYFYLDCLEMYPQITISYDGTNITLDWNAVAGADYYRVYSSTDPYAAFPGGWTLEAASVNGTSWSETYPGGIKFYRVVAVMNVLLRSDTPGELKIDLQEKKLE
jgi:hypothetical protein